MSGYLWSELLEADLARRESREDPSGVGDADRIARSRARTTNGGLARTSDRKTGLDHAFIFSDFEIAEFDRSNAPEPLILSWLRQFHDRLGFTRAYW